MPGHDNQASSGGAGSSIVARPLDTLAQQINQEHALAEQHARTALEHANTALEHVLKAGHLLFDAKALCEHGTWGTWLKDNFNGGERTAQMYMRIASRWPEIEAKAKRVSDLSLRGALELLAEPRQPEEPTLPEVNKILEGIKLAEALRDIRDKRLYREKYASFDAYCLERWGMDTAYRDSVLALVDEENILIRDTAIGLMIERDLSFKAALDYMVTEFKQAQA